MLTKDTFIPDYMDPKLIQNIMYEERINISSYISRGLHDKQ